jgi:uridine kinase
MHHEYLDPTKQYADIVVGEETDVAAGVVAARVNEAAMMETEKEPVL